MKQTDLVILDSIYLRKSLQILQGQFWNAKLLFLQILNNMHLIAYLQDMALLTKMKREKEATQNCQMITLWQRQPRGVRWGGSREGVWRGRRHMDTYGWFMLLYGRNQHNIVVCTELDTTGVKWLSKNTPYDPSNPSLGIYPEKTLIQKDTCTSYIHSSIFSVAKTWK